MDGTTVNGGTQEDKCFHFIVSFEDSFTSFEFCCSRAAISFNWFHFDAAATLTVVCQVHYVQRYSVDADLETQ